MTQALVRLVAVVVSAAVAAGCVNRRVALPPETRPATCRGVVDAFNRASGTPVAWYEVTDRSDRLDMAESCTSVGPAVYGPPLHDEQNAHLPADSLAVLSWNVHVGGGDIIELVEDLRAGRLTDGKPVHDFVVLLQEAFRGGVTVPSVRWRSFPIPRRIEEAPPARSRQDIVQVASALGLGIFYLPSMRNGAAEGSEAEDRGNAILSTRALSDLAGIELPFERQRRVAASATVTGIDAVGNPWQLRLVTAHLNATASIRRLWVFAAAARARQAGHLARVLASNPVPTVIGSDLNSWAGGASEPAFRKLRAHFPQTPDPGEEPTFRRGKRLDYVFLRVPAAWLGQFTTIEDFFGSDHRPLLGWIEFASTTASASATSSYPRAWSFIRMATRFGVRVRPPEAPLTVSRVPFHETTRGRQPGTYNGGCDRLVIVDVHGGGVRCIAA